MAHGQAHMGKVCNISWCCTITGQDNSMESRAEKIHPAVWEICVLANGPDKWANGQMATMLHKYKSGQSQITSNGVNPSSGFRGMHSSPWAYLYRLNSMTLPNYTSKQFHKTFKGKICPVVSKFAFCKVWAPMAPDLKSCWPMSKPTWGKWAKCCICTT